MSDQTPASVENSRTGQDAQLRFSFYMVALTFTILGLSIQTADFGGLVWASVAELVAWFALLVSGLLGLIRLEALPNVYGLFGLQYYWLERLEGIRKARLRGSDLVELAGGPTRPAADIEAEAVSERAKADAALAPLEAVLRRRYGVQRIFFGLGIALLVLARAINGVVAILSAQG